MNQEFLNILACPACKSEIKYEKEQNHLVCQNKECGLIYPVKDSIPVLLVEEARKP